jgi:hypothetical protein
MIDTREGDQTALQGPGEALARAPMPMGATDPVLTATQPQVSAQEEGAHTATKWPCKRRAARPRTLRLTGERIKARKLGDEHKMYVVVRLAGFDSPREVMEGLRADFGIVIARQSVEYYDPTYGAGTELAERWKTLFTETRARVLAGRALIGAANKMVRVRWLDQMVHEAREKGDTRHAAQLLVQAAMEMGDRFTNRQKLEHSGKDGGAIGLAAVSDYDRARAVVALINTVKAAGAPASAPAAMRES